MQAARGGGRRRELQRRVDGFMLRRTADLNAKYLPRKTTWTVFCRPTQLQARRGG